MLKEFREFIMRGNVLDMAVGIIIGGRFRQNRFIFCWRHLDATARPSYGQGKFCRHVHQFDRHALSNGDCRQGRRRSHPLTTAYFFNTVIDFVIVAFAIYLIIRQVKQDEEKTGGSSSGK